MMLPLVNPIRAKAVPYAIRRANGDDLFELVAFLEPFFKDGSILRKTTEQIASEIEMTFVSEHEGKIIGCVILEVLSKRFAEVRSLVVAKEHRKRGLGKCLVDRCIATADELSIGRLIAMTYVEDFVESCGFSRDLPGGVTPMFLQLRDPRKQ